MTSKSLDMLQDVIDYGGDQHISAKEGSSISDIDQRQFHGGTHHHEYVKRPSQLYFHVHIYDGDELAEGVLAGREYRLHVFTQAQPQKKGNGEQISKQSVTSESLELDIGVSGFSEAANTITLSEKTVQIDEKELDSFKRNIVITVDENTPSNELLITVKTKKPDEAYAINVSEYSILIDGTHNPIDQDMAEKCRINPAMERPQKTALLYVTKKGKRKVKLLVWGHYKDHLVNIPAFKMSKEISLANFISESVDRENRAISMIGRIQNFFIYTPDELRNWFSKLYEKHGSELTVIITDLTYFDIPWEMYPLNIDDPDGNIYLGSNVSVVRWGRFRNTKTIGDIILKVQAEKSHGNAIAYIDPYQHSQYENERSLIEPLAHQILGNSQELYDKLEALHDVGLMYIGSHGTFTQDDMLNIGLGHVDNPAERILLPILRSIAPCQKKRPVFFVNACNSARWLDIGGDEQWGLHGTILGNFASAYIGTCGPIGTRFSVEAAKIILNGQDDAEQTDGFLLAKRLQTFRAYMVNKYLQNSKVNVLYAFMYVYYGNPLAQLHLSAEQESEDSDD